ncbi:MAG TPA: PepSY domain-containing protein, partial [Rummeliibacillus sp.]|nr:PepSY domain-containing protein [Rummeliibacillus sp.]
LLVCLAFICVIFLGVKTWFSRKKKGEFSAPPKTSKGISVGFGIIMIVLGIIMPLFGISLLVVALIEICIWLFRKKTIQA